MFKRMNHMHKEAKWKGKVPLFMRRWAGLQMAIISFLVIGLVLGYSLFVQGHYSAARAAPAITADSLLKTMPSNPSIATQKTTRLNFSSTSSVSGCTNPGVTSDSNTSAGNFDGSGSSYSLTELQKSGTQASFIEGDLHFDLNNIYEPDCISNGQVLPVTNATTADKALGLIGSANNGPVAGNATITYGDGTTQIFQLGFSDWTLGGGRQALSYNNKIVTAQLYRNTRTGQQNVKTYLFFTEVALQTGKKVVSVTLPKLNGSAQLHVFGWSTANNNSADMYNNAGASNDAYTQPGNFDHSGDSYPFDAGNWTPGGAMEYQTSYIAPDVVGGVADNYEATGQTIPVDAQGQSYPVLGFVGAASNGPSYGTAYANYADGTRQPFTLGFSDWTLNGGTRTPSFSNQLLGSFKYRNTRNGQQNVATWLFKTEIGIQANKIIQSVTLPASTNQGYIHVFSIALLNGSDNLGSTPDNASFFGNIDGGGYSYSENALKSAHIPMSPLTGVENAFTINGATFGWPTGQGVDPNDIVANGQTLAYSSYIPHVTHIAFLGAATNGASSGTGTILYTDGTTATYTLGFTDWCTTGSVQFGNIVAATLPYRNTPVGKQNIKNYVFYAEAPVDPTKTLKSITLPVPSRGQMHIFDYGYRIGPYNNIGGDSDEDLQNINNFDGSNTGYSYEALGAAGLTKGSSITVNGVTFVWHPGQYGIPDNYQAMGQIVPVTPVANATTLAFLGASANGSSSGTATITYTDGTQRTFTLGLTDWCQTTIAFNNRVVATANYRHTPTGIQYIKTSVYYTDVPLTAGKTIQSITLPDNTHLHIFAIATK